MDDLLNEFLTETSESIDIVDVELVQLEQDPNNKEVLNNIFRLVHTIKGTCGFLGLPRLEKVAHAAENVLGQFRDGTITVTPAAVTVILESLDRIKDILADLEATEEEPEGDDKPLIARLDAIITGSLATAEPEPEPEPAPVEPAAEEEDLRPGEVSLEELEAAFDAAPGPDEGGDDENIDSLYDRCGGEDSLSVAAHLMTTRIENSSKLSAFFADGLKDKLFGLFTAAFQDNGSSAETIAERCVETAGFGLAQFEIFIEEVGSVLVEVGVEPDTTEEAKIAVGKICDAMTKKSAALAEEAGAKKAPGDEGAKKKSDGARTQSIRVNVDLLEDLMNMVSELVLTRNQLMQMDRQTDDSEFSVPLQRLSQCTSELQESVMKTRMQPIGNAWAKLPRIVRDLSVDLKKQIDLVMVGAETELDRQVLEMVKDPLTHMVRNSADHGIELPAERLATGKPEKGTIRLNAFHEGGHIVIEITDDGKGIPVGKLKGKIVEKGLASQAEVDGMTDSQVQKYIFHAGFSMAKKVTNVSGRGVGMDVVRSNIEKIGGTIELNSVEGKGTSLAIKIPLTLAIVSGMIVESAGQRFAIPQISVLELVRASANSEYCIERIKNTPVLRLRSRLLPLVYLNEVLDDTPGAEKGGDPDKDNDQFIVVAQVGTFNFGIVVDQVFDTEEIVVKPLAPILKDLQIYSGNTILGDGTVIMILDPNGIAAMANSSVSHAEEDQDEAEAAASALPDTETILVFRADNNTQKAVPLALVARLEDIEVERLEMADDRHLVQYRGALMPLALLNDRCHMNDTGRQSVIVFTDGERTMGLAVDEILDILEAKLEIELASTTPGVIGSAILDGHATEMIDVSHYMSLAFSDPAMSVEDQEDLVPASGTSLLLVDDSSFFRNMLKPLLAAAGYKVTTASNAQAALDLREEGAEFDLIISDIEMPGMSGFELAETIKMDERWREIPLVALSNLASEKDFDRGREAGFNDYVAKFDRDALLISLSQQLKLREDAA
jgi:two-component system, chemotaxis family, sensor kinase CheA